VAEVKFGDWTFEGDPDELSQIEYIHISGDPAVFHYSMGGCHTLQVNPPDTAGPDQGFRAWLGVCQARTTPHV